MRREAPVSSERYWLVVGRDGARSKTLTLHSRPHGEILPVFGSEEDVGMFLTPLGAFGGGFMARPIAAEDLASLLWGPLSSVETVALDPTSGVDTAAVLDLVSTDRESFVDNLSGERTLAGRGSQDVSCSDDPVPSSGVRRGERSCLTRDLGNTPHRML